MPGLYFEEFSVGRTFAHPIRRTVTEADNVFFTALTHNPAQLHLGPGLTILNPAEDLTRLDPVARRCRSLR